MHESTGPWFFVARCLQIPWCVPKHDASLRRPPTTGGGGGAGAGAGGHTTHGCGGQAGQSSGAEATRGVHAVTTMHGHPADPGVHATPADVKHAGVAQVLPTVATQNTRP